MNVSHDNLYQRLTRRASLRDIVDLFYEKVMADPRVNYFFEGIDMNRLRAHQREFLVYVLGGSADYTGRPLREAHRPLVRNHGLNASHFDAVMEDLAAALLESGFTQAEVDEVAGVVAGVRDDVLDL